MNEAIENSLESQSSYLFVAVEWIDDEFHHTIDFSLESKLFRLFPEFFDLSHI